MRSKDIEFAAVKLPRCLVCGGMKVEWGRHYSRSSEVCYQGTFDEGARQEWKNRFPNASSVLNDRPLFGIAGQSISFIEITEYIYFSLIWSAGELQYKIE